MVSFRGRTVHPGSASSVGVFVLIRAVVAALQLDRRRAECPGLLRVEYLPLEVTSSFLSLREVT